MRVVYGLFAGSLVVALAVGTAASQDTKPVTTVSPPTVSPQAPGVLRELGVRPIAGSQVSVPVDTIKELSEGECTNVGGDVKDIAIKKCGTGKVCITITSDGTIHANCITE